MVPGCPGAEATALASAAMTTDYAITTGTTATNTFVPGGEEKHAAQEQRPLHRGPTKLTALDVLIWELVGKQFF